MLPLYKNLKELDDAALQRYGISEEILMENAANGVKEFLAERGLIDKKTLIVTGGGNNGADGLALARMLPNCSVLKAAEPKSVLCKLQFKRAQKLGVEFVSQFYGFELIIDAIFGSGLNKPLEGDIKKLVETLNGLKAVKVALDIPSGVMDRMGKEHTAFTADFTVTLGAHKEALYSDAAKEFVGEIALKGLGLPSKKYTEGFAPSSYLLEKTDIRLPNRKNKNCNKGDFGHLFIVGGEMIGASIIAAKAALRSGVGLVSIIARDSMVLEPQVIFSNTIPNKQGTVLIGQGLGSAFDDKEVVEIVKSSKNSVIDADLFKKECLKTILALDKETVFTPHPKEFASLLKITENIEVSVDEIQSDRFGFARCFSQKYKNKTLLLKGANTLIAHNGDIFVMPHGTAALAKGGSGDALAGVIASLMAQGYSALDAAKTGSLAIALSASAYKGADYSMTIEDLLDGLKWL